MSAVECLNHLALLSGSLLELLLLSLSMLCLAASTGVESAEDVFKYLLAGADVVITTAALLPGLIKRPNSIKKKHLMWHCQLTNFSVT